MRLSASLLILLILTFYVLSIAGSTQASAGLLPVPKVNLEWDNGDSPKAVSSSVQILILITILSIAPAVLIMMTSFTRIIIVLSFLRHAIGTQSIPPNQVLVSFALFLTFLTMLPTFKTINEKAVQPYLEGKMAQPAAIATAKKPIRDFMFRQTRQKDLELFIYASGTPRPQKPADIPTMVLIPSFALSELRTAFSMGFALFIVFLVIDMVVASILMSIGMFMLPPMMISLPLKIMIFVLVDGWYLVVRSLILSYR